MGANEWPRVVLDPKQEAAVAEIARVCNAYGRVMCADLQRFGRAVAEAFRRTH